MLKRWQSVGILALAVFAGTAAYGADEQEVTIRGAMQCDEMDKTNPTPADQVPVIVAVDGSKEIQDMVKKVMDADYPDKGLDAEAAEKLNDDFDKQLKWYVAPDSPAGLPKDFPKPGRNHYCHSAYPYEITGTIYEKDGKKWIKATSEKVCGMQAIHYPEKMLAPDKPFTMPAKDPVVVKITDALSLNFIKVPAGKIFMDEEEFMAVRYIEQVPHEVTLSKPICISEIPITQEVWEAVMGPNTVKINPKKPAVKGANLPVQDPSTEDVNKFCQLLSTKTGYQVRLPTIAEWEYIERVGTSNPGFPSKYRDQGLFKEDGAGAPLAVKSKKPNAWGFYDLFSPWWELTADGSNYPVRRPETDPVHPVANSGEAKGMHALLGVAGENWTVTEREFQQFSGYTSTKFRVAFYAPDGK